MKTSSLFGKILDGLLPLQCSSTQFIQSIVAADSFRGSKEGRFDSVVVCFMDPSDNGYMQLWFARVLVLDRIEHQREIPSIYVERKLRNCSRCMYGPEKELCFVQW